VPPAGITRSLLPQLTGLSDDLDRYRLDYDDDRAGTGRLTQGCVPEDVVYRARKT
jgi:hypothetical protein